MRIESAKDPSACEKLAEYLAMLEESETLSHLNLCLSAYQKDHCNFLCGVRSECGAIFKKKLDDRRGQILMPINAIEAEA
jgi:hypothetical protein